MAHRHDDVKIGLVQMTRLALLRRLALGVVLALILAGKMSGNLGLGQSTAATVIVADTIVAVVGLALGVQVRRRFGTLDVPKISTLRG